jgi:hypothetical protein
MSSYINTEVQAAKIKAMVIFYLSGQCDLDLVVMETLVQFLNRNTIRSGHLLKQALTTPDVPLKQSS